MRLLDLFSGAGGAAMGYHRAGFEVVGIDINPQKRYPFEHRVADFTTLDVKDLVGFDVVHASPPCQRYSAGHTSCVRFHEVCPHPDLIGPVRDLLKAWGGPYIIENVERAPLDAPALMCGEAFALGATGPDGRRRPLKRHRLFESNMWLMTPGCGCSSQQKIGVYGKGGNRIPGVGHNMFRGYQGGKAEKAEALQVDWMSCRELSEAIPPVYTEYLGEQIMAQL